MTTKPKFKANKKVALKVAESVNGALCSGAGNGEGQNVCVMQAIARAIGRPVNDDHVTECVGEAISAFNRKLNDCSWSTPVARAEGMKALAVASIGSVQLDQMEFGKLMYLRGTQKLLPYMFRKVAKKYEGEQKTEYLKHADLCEKVTTFEEARKACQNASASAYASAASAYASASASASAYASASASALAYASAGDELLRLTADVGVACLKELKSPGCKYLWICDVKEAA